MKRQRLLVISGLVVASAIGVTAWWNGPATGTQKNNDTTVVLGSDDAQTTVSTQRMTFLAPGTMRLKSSNEALARPLVGQYLLADKNNSQTDQIGVTLGLLDGTTLSDNTAVRYRLQNSSLYEQVTLPFTPFGGYAFRGTASYEKSVIWSHGVYYAAVVASGTSDRSADLDAALEMVVSSWQWLD